MPDLYVQNPAFSSILFLSNSNFADYEAFVLTVTRRQFRNWELQGSYTWSRAEGNGEDFQQEFGNDQSLIDDEFGPQSKDQRHFVRLLATWISPIGVRLGGSVRWQSGLPFSLLEDQQAFAQTPPPLQGFGGNVSQVRTIFPTGSRNDQRNGDYWLVDMKLTREFNLGRGVSAQLSAEVFNLFNREYFRVYNDILQQGRVLNGVPEATIDFGRRWQAGFRISF